MLINTFSEYKGYESELDILGNLLAKLSSQDQTTWINNENNDVLSELELIQFLKVIFKIYASKQKRNFYKYGETVTNHIINILNPWSTPNVAQVFCSFIENYERSQKEYAYLGLKTLIMKNPTQIKISMPKLIPIISYDINDSGAKVRQTAAEVLELMLSCSGNDDLNKFIPVVLQGIKKVFSKYEKVCIFQPHRISRLKDLKKEFSYAFKDADEVILCPIFTAGEKIKLGFQYLNFAKEIIKNSKVKLFMVENQFQIAKFVKQNFYGKKIVIGMGAGSISSWMRELPKLI